MMRRPLVRHLPTTTAAWRVQTNAVAAVASLLFLSLLLAACCVEERAADRRLRSEAVPPPERLATPEEMNENFRRLREEEQASKLVLTANMAARGYHDPYQYHNDFPDLGEAYANGAGAKGKPKASWAGAGAGPPKQEAQRDAAAAAAAAFVLRPPRPNPRASPFADRQPASLLRRSEQRDATKKRKEEAEAATPAGPSRVNPIGWNFKAFSVSRRPGGAKKAEIATARLGRGPEMWASISVAGETDAPHACAFNATFPPSLPEMALASWLCLHADIIEGRRVMQLKWLDPDRLQASLDYSPYTMGLVPSTIRHLHRRYLQRLLDSDEIAPAEDTTVYTRDPPQRGRGSRDEDEEGEQFDEDPRENPPGVDAIAPAAAAPSDPEELDNQLLELMRRGVKFNPAEMCMAILGMLGGHNVMYHREVERYPNATRTLFEPVCCPYTMKWHESPRIPADVLCICADPTPLPASKRRETDDIGLQSPGLKEEEEAPPSPAGTAAARRSDASRGRLRPSMLNNQTVVDAVSKAVITCLRRDGLVVILIPEAEEFPRTLIERIEGLAFDGAKAPEAPNKYVITKFYLENQDVVTGFKVLMWERPTLMDSNNVFEIMKIGRYNKEKKPISLISREAWQPLNAEDPNKFNLPKSHRGIPYETVKEPNFSEKLKDRLERMSSWYGCNSGDIARLIKHGSPKVQQATLAAVLKGLLPPEMEALSGLSQDIQLPNQIRNFSQPQQINKTDDELQQQKIRNMINETIFNDTEFSEADRKWAEKYLMNMSKEETSQGHEKLLEEATQNVGDLFNLSDPIYYPENRAISRTDDYKPDYTNPLYDSSKRPSKNPEPTKLGVPFGFTPRDE